MRREILGRAVEECLDEMYRASQPSISWHEILEKCKNGEYPKDEPVVYKHYLSEELLNDIKERYLYGYSITNKWHDHADLVISYLKDGGTKDKWIEGDIGEDGFQFPGHRGYEKTPKLVDALTELIGKENAEIACDKVFELIGYCKDFYRGDREVNQFLMSIFNYSPSSNKERVQEYYPDITIYDVEYDYDEDCYVKVTEETLDRWFDRLGELEDEQEDPWLIEKLTELLQKYKRIPNG